MDDLDLMADPRQLAARLALDVEAVLAEALAARPRASLVVSGGRTPIALFRHLRQAPLDWARMDITLADERWVDPDQPGSNEGLVRRELLQERATAARFVAMKVAQPTPQQGAAEAWAAICVMPRPFDLVLLGMGDDGHTASLFPGSPRIHDALDLRAPPGCVPMSAPVAPQARLSLNLSAIAASRAVWLHFTGQQKLDLFEAARLLASRVDAGEAPASRLATLPVSAVLRLRAPRPRLYWSP
jgi:6-phosphogluconolactonase